MARRREQGRRRTGAGWFVTLLGAAVLVVVGFGLGLVSGALFEEPGLVMEHLTGHTHTLPLPAQQAATPGAASPAVAAGPPPTPSAGQPADGPRPSVAAAPPPRSKARVAGGHYVIQVGAFGSRQSAEALVRTLASSGLPGYIADEAGGPVRYKVRVGPFGTRQEADAVALRLKREKQLPTWVLSRDAN